MPFPTAFGLALVPSAGTPITFPSTFACEPGRGRICCPATGSTLPIGVAGESFIEGTSGGRRIAGCGIAGGAPGIGAIIPPPCVPPGICIFGGGGGRTPAGTAGWFFPVPSIPAMAVVPPPTFGGCMRVGDFPITSSDDSGTSTGPPCAERNSSRIDSSFW